jgi:hypothetical protein
MDREDHIPADLKENHFVCKLCKTFCGIKQKSLQPDYLKNHKTHKAFYKDYRRRYLFRDFTHTWYQTWSQENNLLFSSCCTASGTMPSEHLFFNFYYLSLFFFLAGFIYLIVGYRYLIS